MTDTANEYVNELRRRRPSSNMHSMRIYPDDRLVQLRLLQRYMSAGILSLIIARGGFIVSFFLLITGSAFIVVGHFFFWERYRLYGCRLTYATSIYEHICSRQWQEDASGHMDTSTVACLISGSFILLVALVYPYTLLAIKGTREETEEVRSIIHLEYRSTVSHRNRPLRDWELSILHLLGLRRPFPLWSYFEHKALKFTLAQRRRLRRFSACLWTEVFARITLKEYTVPVLLSLLVLASAIVSPCLMTESSALLRVGSVIASLVAYVAVVLVSASTFLVILVIDPSAWMGCLAFWAVYLLIHFGCFALHLCASAVPRLLNGTRLPNNVPSTVLRAVLEQMF